MSSKKESKLEFEVVPPNPPNDGIPFVDHSVNDRSGHLGHALVEYEPGRILAFYPNCSAKNKGHTGDGWMEYKRSEDGGQSWSEPAVLPYSKKVYESGNNRAVMCEKAIKTDEGNILLFNFEHENSEEYKWRWIPIDVPTYLQSSDGGRTWSEARQLGDEPGRIWDAIVHEGAIYVLELFNDSRENWYGCLPEHHYSLYVSTDSGKTFSRRSILPFDIMGRGYGTMEILPNGDLIAYIYNTKDEKNLEYTISSDAGHTWSAPEKAFFARQIRNPQMVAFNGGYVLHGRSGSYGDPEIKGHFVLYTSSDGINWDEGRYLKMQTAGAGAYSNNVLVHDPENAESSRLLIQASHAYEQSKTNIYHWWLK